MLVRNFVSKCKDCEFLRAFSSSAAASTSNDRVWPPGGSWEYAIEDYKLRKQG